MDDAAHWLQVFRGDVITAHFISWLGLPDQLKGNSFCHILLPFCHQDLSGSTVASLPQWTENLCNVPFLKLHL